MKRNPRSRAFVRITSNGDVVPGSLIIRRNKPKSGGRWIEINENVCCTTSTTTTTTTT